MSRHVEFIGRGAMCAGWLLSLAAGGCTKFASELDVNDETGSETLPIEPEDWGCVSEESGNPIMSPNGPPLDYSISARDFLSGQTPTNLRMRACYRPDVGCMRPATAWLTPDLEGVVTLPLTEGFSGYLEIMADDEVPTLFVFPASLSAELIAALGDSGVTLLPPDALQAFGAASQLALDQSTGVIVMDTFDCTGPSGAGVRLQLNAAAVPFSFVDGLPIAGLDTTTDDGAVGFANVAPGLVVVQGFWGEEMLPVGLETVMVRPMWVTVGSLMPRYAGTP